MTVKLLFAGSPGPSDWPQSGSQPSKWLRPLFALIFSLIKHRTNILRMLVGRIRPHNRAGFCRAALSWPNHAGSPARWHRGERSAWSGSLGERFPARSARSVATAAARLRQVGSSAADTARHCRLVWPVGEPAQQVASDGRATDLAGWLAGWRTDERLISVTRSTLLAGLANRRRRCKDLATTDRAHMPIGTHIG